MKAVMALAVLITSPVWATTSLGAPPGHSDAFVQALLVNAHGAAVAIGDEGVGTNNSQQQAFVWQNGKKTTLAYHGARNIQPTAIDAAGDVLGNTGTAAVLWRKSVPTALGAFVPSAMNDDGRFVVGTGNVGAYAHAYVWQNGTLTDLPGLGGTQTGANAVSSSGTVVGYSALPSGVEHAVSWRNGVVADLGSVSSLDSVATLVGGGGTIFGFASTHVGSARTAVEWKAGRLIDLGRFGAGGAQPVAVNTRGDVLIQTQTASQEAIGLVLIRGTKTTQILVPKLGRQGLWAVGLDDKDDVVGYGVTTLRGFLWRNGRATLLPPDEQPTAVAGGWVSASNAGGGGVLLRLRG